MKKEPSKHPSPWGVLTNREIAERAGIPLGILQRRRCMNPPCKDLYQPVSTRGQAHKIRLKDGRGFASYRQAAVILKLSPKTVKSYIQQGYL